MQVWKWGNGFHIMIGFRMKSFVNLLFLFILSRGLFASNYTETHYLEDGSVVTGSHNFTVCFKQLFIFSFFL